MMSQKGYPVRELLIFIVIFFVCLGWGQGVYKFCRCDFEKPYKAEISYGVGLVVPPVGVIIGWLDLGK